MTLLALSKASLLSSRASEVGFGSLVLETFQEETRRRARLLEPWTHPAIFRELKLCHGFVHFECFSVSEETPNFITRRARDVFIISRYFSLRFSALSSAKNNRSHSVLPFSVLSFFRRSRWNLERRECAFLLPVANRNSFPRQRRPGTRLRLRDSRGTPKDSDNPHVCRLQSCKHFVILALSAKHAVDLSTSLAHSRNHVCCELAYFQVETYLLSFWVAIRFILSESVLV